MSRNPLKTEAIKAFLNVNTHPELARLYNHDMEVQVNVAQDGGTRVDNTFKGRQWHGFTDGLTTWKPIRIPYNANVEPEYEDRPISYDLAAHVEGIGMTGWDWKNRLSRHVGFDFDAMVGHSEAHSCKLTDKQLAEVQQAAFDIPWVTVRRSTSGNGLHIYVFVDPVSTANHNEHAALARAIIGMMAAKTGFDFQSKVDICGGNMWVWHRKMKGTNGLTLIKQGTILYDIPPNWRDHVKVVKGVKKRTVPLFIEEAGNQVEDLFDDLTGKRNNVPLDEEHRKLINWLEENGYPCAWDQDRHMLTTHTVHLKQAHEELSLKGLFDTKSSHSSPMNCYLFPMRKGAWAVRRFSPGVQEHGSWTQDGAGWTQCYYNRNPDLPTAARSHGGSEIKSGGFAFSTAEEAMSAAKQLGIDMEVPRWALTKAAKLKEHKDGRLVAEIDFDPKRDAAAGGIPGWHLEGKTWTHIFNANLRQPAEIEVGNYDDVVRHLITETGEDCGWALRSEDVWVTEPLTHVRAGLQGALGLGSKEVSAIIGGSVFRHWKLVNRPFKPEYPGDRQWNRRAAQFAYHPTENRDNLQYPTWTKILNHCGQGLDDAIRDNNWCKSNGILTGGDYLKVWVASLFQKPHLPLPYLFFYSKEQNTGKSSFHEALSELVTSGVERADAALTNPQGFNAEIANAVLCVVEEINLSVSKVAYNRIKDWVTSRRLPVHEKGLTPYSVPNTTHWVQTANDYTYCKVFPGDTRITMTYVRPLPPEDLIPKERLLEALRKEAPDFLAEVLNLEIPPSNDRLNVPVISTTEKLSAQQSNLNALESFLDAMTYRVDGKMIKFGEFVVKFHDWLDANDVHEWTKIKIGKMLPPHCPKGRRPQDGQFYIGNIAWTPSKNGDPVLPKLVLSEGGNLVPIGAKR